MIPSILEAIYHMSVSVPVRQGDVLETVRGVQIVATRSIDS
jgi:CxxC motif-containing protein